MFIFGEVDAVFVRRGEIREYGLHRLARPAPRSPEVHDDGTVG